MLSMTMDHRQLYILCRLDMKDNLYSTALLQYNNILYCITYLHYQFNVNILQCLHTC